MNNSYITLRAGRELKNSEREANEEIVAILDALCHEIELPPSRVADAKSRYETIGKTLAGENSTLHEFGPRIFAQGSIALGTPVKPLKTYEFDVDLACVFSRRPGDDTESVRTAVFKVLNGNGYYTGKVKMLPRCIQLLYADEFHMDIMPCIPGNQGCLYVPDKRVGNWVATDPEGYAKWFHACASLAPMTIRKNAKLENRAYAFSANAQVDPFPEWDGLKKRPLQRCTQLLKRHRDRMFYDDNSKAPSSIVITTLAGQSYSRAVQKNDYDSTLKLLEDVVAGMTDFVLKRTLPSGLIEYSIPNPILPSENFASKWQSDPKLPVNFFSWHAKALTSIQKIAKTMGSGIPEIGSLLAEDYGSDSAKAAVRVFSQTVEKQRNMGNVSIITGGGHNKERSQPIPYHTNFGR